MSTGEFTNYEENLDKVTLDQVADELKLPYVEVSVDDEDLVEESLKEEVTTQLIQEEFDTNGFATNEHQGFDSGQPTEEFILSYMEDPIRNTDLEETEELSEEALLEEAEGRRDFEPSTNMNEKIYAVSRLAEGKTMETEEVL
jgi:hypothetical protein